MTANPIKAYGFWLADAPGDWPEAAWESAHRQFVDIVAVSVRGAAEEATRRVFATVKPWGEGCATAIGTGMRIAPPFAALVNGTAAHALDFDDNFDPGKAHATAVLAPAILALAEQEAASGKACLDAYIAGLQILGRVGQGVNPIHRHRGWHATGTVGAIGAAAACARLLRLPAEQAAFALSIATSMAGGFMSQFGSMTKPMHAGLAAKAGVMAASLAANGVTAGWETLDGPNGMNRLMVGPDFETLRARVVAEGRQQMLRYETEAVGDPLLILSDGLKTKRFPNCASAHRAMDALLEIKAANDFTAGELDSVTVRAARNQLNNLMYTEPRDPLEAKFSLEYGLAVLILDGNLGLSHFEPGAVLRPDVRALYPKICRVPVDTLDSLFPTEVTVTLKDGRTFSAAVALQMGSLAAPFGWDQIWDKFRLCLDNMLAPSRVAELRETLTNLAGLDDVSAMMRILAEPRLS